jgi:hypothetical protein
MRASEFLLEAKKKYEIWRDYLSRLMSMRIHQLGQGAYAHVFQHPVYNNIAVKAFKPDAFYIEYIDWIFKNPNNRYTPQFVAGPDGKIIHTVRIIDENGANVPMNFVFMKKYLKANRVQLIQQFQIWDKIAGLPSRPGNYGNVGGFSAGGNWAKWANSPQLRQQDPDAWALTNYFAQNHNNLDLHQFNYMWDETSQNIVFTDPFAS